MQKIILWAEYNKDEEEFTGNFLSGGKAKPGVSSAYNWLDYRKVEVTIKPLTKKKKKK